MTLEVKSNNTPPEKKRGCIRDLIIIIGVIALIGLAYLGMAKLMYLVPQHIAFFFILVGLISFLIGKLLVKKKSLIYKTKNNGDIQLSSPKYIDLLLWMGQIIVILGVMMAREITDYLSNNILLGLIIGCCILLYLTINIIRVIKIIDDKIIITNESVAVISSIGEKSKSYPRSNIVKIVHQKVKTEDQYRRFKVSYKILFHVKESEEITCEEIDPEFINIKMDVFIQALNQKNYKIEKETLYSYDDDTKKTVEGHV